jgi:hypothetical protein
MDLSLNLKGMISQRLIPRRRQGPRVAIEIMLNSPLISDLIFKGEVHEIKELMKKSRELGMQTFDQSLFDLHEADLITYEDALRNADSVNDLRLPSSWKARPRKPRPVRRHRTFGHRLMSTIFDFRRQPVRPRRQPEPVPGQGPADRQHRQQVRLHARSTRAWSGVPAVQGQGRGSAGLPVQPVRRRSRARRRNRRLLRKNYGVSFPLFAKIDVNGDHAHPLFQKLKKDAPASSAPKASSGTSPNS